MFVYFGNCRSAEEVKREYRRLTKIHHPDLGGDTATMQAINAEYEDAIAFWEQVEQAARAQAQREETQQAETQRKERAAPPKKEKPAFKIRWQIIKRLAVCALLVLLIIQICGYVRDQYVSASLEDFVHQGTYSRTMKETGVENIYVFDGAKLRVYTLSSTSNTRIEYTVDGYYCVKGLFGSFWGNERITLYAGWADNASIFRADRESFVHRTKSGEYVTTQEGGEDHALHCQAFFWDQGLVLKIERAGKDEGERIELTKISVPSVAAQQMMASLDIANKKALAAGGTHVSGNTPNTADQTSNEANAAPLALTIGLVILLGVIWTAKKFRTYLSQLNLVWCYIKITLAYWITVMLGPAAIALTNELCRLVGFGFRDGSIGYTVLTFVMQPISCALAYYWVQKLMKGEHYVCVSVNLIAGVSFMSVLAFAEFAASDTTGLLSMGVSLLITAICLVKLIACLCKKATDTTSTEF